MHPQRPIKPQVAKRAWISAAIPVLLPCFFLTAGSSVSIAAPSAPVSAEALYQQSLVSTQSVSYKGREFITQWNDDGRQIAYVTDVAHRAPDLFRIEYRAPRTMVGRVIIRSGAQEWTYIPEGKVVLHTAPPSAVRSKPTPGKLPLLKSNYNVSVSPLPERIADRKTFLVSVRPKDAAHDLLRLWIDPYTGLVLRREKFRPDGTLSVVSYFSEMDVHPTFSASAFSPDKLKGSGVRQMERRDPTSRLVPHANVAGALFGLAQAPPQIGKFKLQSAIMMGQEQGGTLHLRYSDGLNTLSLFESRRTSKGPTHVSGSTPVPINRNMVGRYVQRYSYGVLSWDDGRLNLTIVGDANEQMLTEFADQLCPLIRN